MPSNIIRARYLVSVTLVASGLGMFLVWLRQSNYGIAISPDSTLYISLAESLTEGEGFIDWSGGATTGNLFPLTLSIIISLGFTDKFSAAAAYLNIVAFGLSIFVLIIWLSFKIRSGFIILYVGTVYAISPLLGHEHARLLTEPLSVLFVVTSLFALDRFLDSNKRYWIILAAISSALEFLTHPIGAFLVIGILIILAINHMSAIAKIKYISIYLSITMSAIGLYLLQNFVRTAQLIRPQYDLPFSHSSSIDTLSFELFKWIFGDIIFDYLETKNFDINSISAGVIIFVMLLAIFGVFWSSLQSQKRLKEFGRLATPLVFILIYILVMYISLAISGRSGPVRGRYLIPIYGAFLVIVAVILDRILRRIWAKCVIVFVAGFMIFRLISDVTTSYENIKEWRDYGFGYLAEGWIDSETIDYLNSNPVAGLIYSNNIRPIYINYRIPDNDGIYFRSLPPELPQDGLSLRTTNRSQSFDPQNVDMHVVWFNDGKDYKNIPLHYNLVSLTASSNLEVVAALEDGIILKRNRESPRYFEELGETAILESIVEDARLISLNTRVDIYLDDKRMIYVSTLCGNIDIESRFFLHIYPANRADRWNNDLDFNNYDFSFSRERIFWGEGCAVIRNLPDYDIGTIRTGQFTANEGELWMEEFRPESLYQQSAP